MAASDFGGTNIRIELDAATGAAPEWERSGYASTRHVAGGTSDVTQVLGTGSETIALRLLVDGTEWSALKAKLLTEAELVMAGVSQGTCLLERIDGARALPDGWRELAATFRRD